MWHDRCEEITPRFFELDHVPFENMFADDSSWLPPLLASMGIVKNQFRGRYHYKEGGDTANAIDFFYLDQGKG